MEMQGVLQLRPSSVPALCPAAQLATNKSIGMASSTLLFFVRGKAHEPPSDSRASISSSSFLRHASSSRLPPSSSPPALRIDQTASGMSACSSTTGSRRWLRLSIDGVDDATYQSWSSRDYLFAWLPVHDALTASVYSGRASASDVTAALSLTESALPPPS
jgi:hypothetical protein